MIGAQTRPQPISQFIGHLVRSFFSKLAEIATAVDELPLEDKQGIKEGLVRFLSVSGKHAASIKLLTREDNELSHILSARGWWVLQRDINGPVKRALLRLGLEGESSEIDSYICSLFSQNDGARLKERIEAWFKLAYFADRKVAILDSFEAHKAGKWTLTVPTLLPLVDGVARQFHQKHLRRIKNSKKVIQVDRFIAYYRRNQPKLFGKSFASFIRKDMFARFDFTGGISPRSINRHAILHGEVSDYATEANSLRVFLILDAISQFVQTVERRKISAATNQKPTSKFVK